MANSIKQIIGKRIRLLRTSKDMVQQEMADKLSITPGAYAKIERGETDPSITRLLEIANILKVDITELITGKSSPSSEPDLATQIGLLTKDIASLKAELAALKKRKK